ncbi:MAG: TspO/MBR family protein [Patescibacteria group bacterium]
MNLVKLIISIIICQLAGGIGALFTTSAIPTWYKTLNKPVFSPPNWLFGPVWTLLYALMGISAYLIYQEGIGKKEVRAALVIFGGQLVLNALWSILFFGLKNPLLAFGEIILLWLFIILTIIKFYALNRTAAYLLLPYLFWVSFASILNFSIWYLNK